MKPRRRIITCRLVRFCADSPRRVVVEIDAPGVHMAVAVGKPANAGELTGSPDGHLTQLPQIPSARGCANGFARRNVLVGVVIAVGAFVGIGVGIAVGAFVGIGVGSAVGAFVGIGVGSAVGAGVGVAVGKGVGETVG